MATIVFTWGGVSLQDRSGAWAQSVNKSLIQSLIRYPINQQANHLTSVQCLTSSGPVGRRVWPAAGPAADWSPSWCWTDGLEAPDEGRRTTCAHRRWSNLENRTQVKVVRGHRTKPSRGQEAGYDRLDRNRSQLRGNFNVFRCFCFGLHPQHMIICHEKCKQPSKHTDETHEMRLKDQEKRG